MSLTSVATAGAQMRMKTGRDREVGAIVSHDRAVEVARLLMGKLNGPMRRIFPEDYRSLPRRNLRSGKASLRDGRAAEVEGFCERNFGTTDVGTLAGLYALLYEHKSEVRLPLKEFAGLVGQPQEGVLRGAPRHSTVAISPWGLQTEYPEMHLVRDMAVAFNSGVSLDREIKQHERMSWEEAKRDERRKPIADLDTRAAFHRRMCVLSCFNLIEAYIDGVAWDFTETHGSLDAMATSHSGCRPVTRTECSKSESCFRMSSRYRLGGSRGLAPTPSCFASPIASRPQLMILRLR